MVSAVSGRDVSEFGTVRPRVQIPGPRPKSVRSHPDIWIERRPTLDIRARSVADRIRATGLELSDASETQVAFTGGEYFPHYLKHGNPPFGVWYW